MAFSSYKDYKIEQVDANTCFLGQFAQPPPLPAPPAPAWKLQKDTLHFLMESPAARFKSWP